LFFEKGQLHFVVNRAGIRSGLASADVALACGKANLPRHSPPMEPSS
jgi:hypothetical protein